MAYKPFYGIKFYNEIVFVGSSLLYAYYVTIFQNKYNEIPSMPSSVFARLNHCIIKGRDSPIKPTDDVYLFVCD